MRGADTLIPARFLTLLGHLCVLITLLWESKLSVQHCLPKQHHGSHFQIYHRRLVAGLAASVALIVIEFITFILGLTMFSPSVSLTSIGSHGLGSIMLTYFILDGWICDWFWPIFIFCSMLPSCIVNEHQHLTQTLEYKPGWSFYLVLAGVVTTLGSSLPVGYNIGVVNTPAEVIKTFCNESFVSRYNLPLDETWLNVLWSSVVSIFIIGGCTGSVLGSVLANKLGRKNATIVTSALSIAGALLFLLCRAANSVEMLIVGRLLVGLSAGLTTSIVPMYLTELSPLRLSGAMGVACPMGVNVGVLVGQVMGLNFFLGGVDDWPYLLSVYAMLVIICLPVLCILPESPKYLFIIKRNEVTAVKELSRLRGVSQSVLRDELDALREERDERGGAGAGAGAGRGEGRAWSMARLLASRRLRLPLLLLCAAQAGQQTSGINAVRVLLLADDLQAGGADGGGRAVRDHRVRAGERVHGGAHAAPAAARRPPPAAARLLARRRARARRTRRRHDRHRYSFVDALCVYDHSIIVRPSLRVRSRAHTVFYRFGDVRSGSPAGGHGVGLAGQLGRQLPRGHVLPHHAPRHRPLLLPRLLCHHRRTLPFHQVVLPGDAWQYAGAGDAKVRTRLAVEATQSATHARLTVSPHPSQNPLPSSIFKTTCTTPKYPHSLPTPAPITPPDTRRISYQHSCVIAVLVFLKLLFNIYSDQSAINCDQKLK